MEYFDLAQTSLVKLPSSVTEFPIPLWFADGTTVSTTSITAVLIQDGSTSTNANNSVVSQNKLHTLDANWTSFTKFAFEATVYGSSGTTGATAGIWDVTANALVTNGYVLTTSTTAAVVRTGQLTLTPGHVYGVGIWTQNSSYAAYMTDASLIVFP